MVDRGWLTSLELPGPARREECAVVRATDDGFLLSIDASDPAWDESKAREVLAKAGGKEITLIRDLEP